MQTDHTVHAAPPALERRMGVWSATALNMSNMVGVGPFITLPILTTAMGGPQAIFGWFVALLITIPDAMVWSELGAAKPGSGGTYRWLREGFGSETWGRLMAFLFLWQLIVSGPLEIGSGYIGFLQYLNYLWPGVLDAHTRPTFKGGCVLVVVGLLIIAILWRRIGSIATLTLVGWVGVILCVGMALVCGLSHFDAGKAFDWSRDTNGFLLGFTFGSMGAAARIGIYDFLGYYDICYLGDEVKQPGKTIPRAVITSLLAVAVIYVGLNLALVGSIHWSEFVPNDKHPETAPFVFSILIERAWGTTAAQVFTVLLLWTAVFSIFALLLGYSRIPYAAARDGLFLRVFAKLHPTKHFPHLSLLAFGVLSIAAGFLTLQTLLDTLVALRIVVQFIGQIVALVLLRKHEPGLERPYRVWLYPLPLLLALAGWAFVFGTAGWTTILWSLLSIAAGSLGYLLWAAMTGKWPFSMDRTEKMSA